MPFSLTRFIALLTLLVHCLGGASASSLLVLTLAEQDDSHEVRVEMRDRQISVVLHHSREKFTPRVTDHTTPLAQALSSLCAINGQGDHVFEQPRLTSSTGPDRDSVMRSVLPGLIEQPPAFHLSTIVPLQISATRHGKQDWSQRPQQGLGTIALLI